MNFLRTTLILLLSMMTTLQLAVAETVTYVHTDALGSPVAETDFSGKILWQEHYSPYGERVNNSSSTNDIGFTGHEFDLDTGLTYMQARYYDPVIGRFYSNDPLGFRDVHSFNRYAYANNNPYKYVDPDGRYVRVAHVSPGFGLGAAGHTFLGNGDKAYSTAINVSGLAVGNFDSVVQGYLKSGRNVTVYTLERQSSSVMEGKINDILKDYDPGVYFPLGNNCSDAVVDILNKAGAMEGNTSQLGALTPDGTANSPTSVNGYLNQEFQANQGHGVVKGLQVHRVSGRIESKKLEKELDD
ncbi:RHS repeat-associated core domain-containing protein [Ferrimonas futtsuensis]|uniref:RHS repeat-associated core domain-containing protein n=1 Tax=Ferrimonas futtsuensis TaxID=364764 RepID=UPI000687073C|nr:RHS repeat-associated core domain-containing protein [Ferrimonas futtsuensis]